MQLLEARTIGSSRPATNVQSAWNPYLHAYGGCGHPKHANWLIPCCRCNTFKGPDDHQLDRPEIRRRANANQGRIIKVAKQLHDGWYKAPAGTTREQSSPAVPLRST